MIGILNLIFAFVFPGLLDWWTKWHEVAEPTREFAPNDFAVALASIAGILILGLGGVLIIGLCGRTVRRLYFSKPSHNASSRSAMTELSQADWTRSHSATEESDEVSVDLSDLE